MLQIKRITSVLLALALLCALPVAARAEDTRAQDLSEYPCIFTRGGFHELRMYEDDSLEWRRVFDQFAVADLAQAAIGDLLDALKSLDICRVTDILKQVLWDWLGEIRMDESGESVIKNIRDNRGRLDYDSDWRLSPIENADRLAEYLTDLEEIYGETKFNINAMSAPAATVLAYLDKYGTDKVASVVFNITMHNGSSLFGDIAKREFMLNVEALSRMNAFDAFGMDMTALQPILRGLFEPGVLDIVERFLKLATKELLERLYDEAVIPLLFMMPSFWIFVPTEDYAEAKRALLKNDPKYAGLVEKIDAWHEIALRADDIILETAKTAKVAVWAGYGNPLLPVGAGAAVQSDSTVDTRHASLGAACAPIGLPFLPCYRQKIRDGHSHISPDRLVDASTCLLPEQTWFAKNKFHNTDIDYDGWLHWFFTTPNPTVHGNPRYPQFMERIGGNEFVPVENDETPALTMLKTIGLYLLRIWRRLLLLPLFWVDWVT